MFSNTTSSGSPHWYPDLGASHHVTAQSQYLQNLQPYEGPDQVFLGNGQGLSISSTGSTCFSSPLNPSVPLYLHNLLHVPHISKNLLSVSKFAKDNNVYFEFHPSFCVVKSQGSNQVLLHGLVGSDGLYHFPNLLPQSSHFPSVNSVCNTVSNSSTFLLWHSRLGHPNVDTLRIVLNSCNVPIPNKVVTDFCISWCMGKSHRLPSFPSTTFYTAPLQLISSDL